MLPGLAGVFNNHFKTGWTKQAVTINKDNNEKACVGKTCPWWIEQWESLTTSVPGW